MAIIFLILSIVLAIVALVVDSERNKVSDVLGTLSLIAFGISLGLTVVYGLSGG